jgi:quercetin dioxygenase-like cupin family protein
MRREIYIVVAAVAALAALASLVPLTADASRELQEHETVTLLAARPIPHVTGKRLVSLLVEYPPGAKSVSHRHAGSAFIYAYVVSGEIRSQVNEEAVRVYKSGEWWFENPGSHHRVSENASQRKPATLLAVFIVDETETELTTPDSHVAED